MGRLVATWTGCRADSLRQAMRMTNESFAEHLGVAVRTVANWRLRPDMIPSPAAQDILDTALTRASERARDHFWALQGARGPALESGGAVGRMLGSEDPASLT